MNTEVQKALDIAFEHVVRSYLYVCERAQILKERDDKTNRGHYDSARERLAGQEMLLGALLDAHGYDVRMPAPKVSPEQPEGAGFVQWTKVEREVIMWGYDKGHIERDHMLAWFDRN